MNIETTEADVEATVDQIKAAVLRDLTPQELADRLMVARGSDDPGRALDNAFTDLMKAASRLLCKRALNGRTTEQLSDDEYDNLPRSADPSIIIRALVDDYSVKEVCKWAKAAGEEEDE